MKTLVFTRKQFYGLVWSKPVVSLAKKYLISETELRKLCKKLDVPLPKVGHWSKLQARKPVVMEKLPSAYTGEQEVELFLREEGDDKDNMVSKSPEVILRGEIENDSSLSLIGPTRLSNPDELIVAYKNNLKENYSNYRSTIYIRVSKENLDRSLRFMDTLIKCLRKRGHEFVSDGSSMIKWWMIVWNCC